MFSDFTPIAVSLISAFGAIVVGIVAVRGNRKTEKKVEAVPQTLVQEFARLNPGVDTVEKVIELLYTEIERLKKDLNQKDERIDKLVAEKADLLNEVQHLKNSLSEHRKKLEYLEARIQQSITNDETPKR